MIVVHSMELSVVRIRGDAVIAFHLQDVILVLENDFSIYLTSTNMHDFNYV